MALENLQKFGLQKIHCDIRLCLDPSLASCISERQKFKFVVRRCGGRGYMTEFEVERHLRDAMGGVIYSGTSDIQRNLIAGLLGL